MRNPLKFFQEVKQEAFKVTWPTGKETVQGTIMVAIMATIAIAATIKLPCKVSFPVGQVTLNASCLTS